MYCIETDQGRFEAETEIDAKRAMRAAHKKQLLQDTLENEKYVLARLRAGQSAYRVYERNGRRVSLPPGWRIMPTTPDTWAVREITHNDQRGYQIETEDGRAIVCPYDSITHHVENGSGYCMAIVIDNQDCDLFALGVAGDRAAWLPLYGISTEDFAKA